MIQKELYFLKRILLQPCFSYVTTEHLFVIFFFFKKIRNPYNYSCIIHVL